MSHLAKVKSTQRIYILFYEQKVTNTVFFLICIMPYNNRLKSKLLTLKYK
jgi:hypothetical protein